MAARISPPVSLTADSPLVRGGLGGIVGRGIPDAPSAGGQRPPLRPWDLYVPCAAVGAGPRPARPICTFGTRRGGACPSRRVCAAPFDWGHFAAPTASPFWSDPKGAKKSPGFAPMDRPHPYQNGCGLSIGANPGDLFAPFGSLQKGLAAGAAKRPPNQTVRHKPGGRDKPLPYGYKVSK